MAQAKMYGYLINLDDDELTALQDSMKPDKEALFARLWEACTAYRKERISEEGMIFLFPYRATGKAKEVYDWVQALWNEYYTRKATIDAGGTASFDFSSVGKMPHTFLEVKTEVEGK